MDSRSGDFKSTIASSKRALLQQYFAQPNANVGQFFFTHTVHHRVLVPLDAVAVLGQVCARRDAELGTIPAESRAHP